MARDLGMKEEILIQKIRSLPREKIKEVNNFVEFLKYKEERELTTLATKIAEPSFQRVWDNPEDAGYDNL